MIISMISTNDYLKESVDYFSIVLFHLRIIKLEGFL